MKKRLLSAALALAMVLTLIPATVVPAAAKTVADNSGEVLPTNVWKTYDKDGNGTQRFAGPTANDGYNTVTVTYQAASESSTGREAGKWYWTDNVHKDANGDNIYYYVNSGLVSGTGNSGSWYPDFAAFTKADESLRGTSFTMLGDVSVAGVLVNSNPKAPTSLTIDVNGHNLTLPGNLPDKFSSLTITNRLDPLSSTYSGSVSTIAKNTEYRTSGNNYANLTVSVSNTTVGGINLTGGANSVTLNHVNVSGGITMDGHSETTDARGGKTNAYGNQTLNVNSNGLNNLSTTTSVGSVVITKAGSATVKLYNAVGGPVSINSNGGTVEVNGASSLGAVTVGTFSGDVAPATLTINGGTVGKISRVDGDASSSKASTVTINAAGSAASLELDNATVKVNQGEVAGNLKVGSGSLALAGPVNTGDITLTDIGATTLSITGSGSKIGNITATDGAKLTISGWPAGRKNTFGALNLGDFRARGVKGGTFTSNANMADSTKALWFDTDLQYVVNMQNGTYGLYGKNELATAISDISSTTAGAAAEMHILCQTSPNTLNLVNGGLTWAKIGYQQPTGMILPTMVNSYSISVWTSGDNNSNVTAGRETVIPVLATGSFTLYANSVATTVAKSITRVEAAQNSVQNQNVRVALNGTNIQISGAITPAPGSNIATILLNLTTDALATGNSTTTSGGGTTSNGYITLRNVPVFYNVDTKTVSFSPLQTLDGGAIINEVGELVLNNGSGTHYTVSANLVQSASSLNNYIYDTVTLDTEIVATVGGSLSRLSQAEKDQIIAQVAGAGAEFKIDNNRAIMEAINAAQATITSDSTVSGWVTNAQNYVWKNGNAYKNSSGQALTVGKGNGLITPHTGNLSTTGNFGSDGVTIQNLYSKAYVVPYLVVNVTDMNKTGTMTATMTVYYRVDVSGASYNPNEYYTVKTGTPLSTLTGDMATSPVRVKFANAFPYPAATEMHQDGKYVYALTGGYWNINHAGSGNGSLGTIVLNSTPGPITLTSTIVGRAPALVAGVTYDDLQAAIDDTVPGIVTSTGSTSSETMDTVTIGGTYAPTECTISMTGIARKVNVVSNGNRKITRGNSNTEVQTLDGMNFTIQLLRDNVAVGTVALAAQGTAQGTVSLSVTSAKVGETVTVTIVPNAGQTARGITVRTNTGAAVDATSTGRVNEYSFVVPNGATSITVTPNFTVSGDTRAAVSVVSATGGSAYTSALATDNKAAQGSTLTVTAVPNNGYRSMGVIARTDTGANVAVTRTGTNTWDVVVPVGATIVTVTPSFDINNGTPFTDVMNSYWASKYISWAYQNKYIEGTGKYAYSPANYMTLGEVVSMLYKAAGSPPVTGMNNPFTNLAPGGHWAYNAFIWAANQGLISGGTVNPWGYATRAEIVQILYKRANSPAVSGTSGFADVASNASYAKAVTWARQKGLTNGYNGNTNFAPGYAVSRAEMAAFLARAFGNIA